MDIKKNKRIIIFTLILFSGCFLSVLSPREPFKGARDIINTESKAEKYVMIRQLTIDQRIDLFEYTKKTSHGGIYSIIDYILMDPVPTVANAIERLRYIEYNNEQKVHEFNLLYLISEGMTEKDNNDKEIYSLVLKNRELFIKIANSSSPNRKYFKRFVDMEIDKKPDKDIWMKDPKSGVKKPRNLIDM